MIANRCVVPCGLVALFPLLHTAKIISRVPWGVRPKMGSTNGIVGYAGKSNAPLRGSIMPVAAIAFWNVIKKPIVLSCEFSSSGTT